MEHKVMIKKRSMSTGINANISLEPQAASQSTSNINNNQQKRRW